MLSVLHASVAFKGGDIQKFWERGRTLYRGTLHFMEGLDNPLEIMPWIKKGILKPIYKKNKLCRKCKECYQKRETVRAL